MDRQEAIRRVAEHLIGHLNGSVADEIVYTDDSKSEKQVERAIEEITMRLSRMGKPRRKRVAKPLELLSCGCPRAYVYNRGKHCPPCDIRLGIR